MGLNARPSYRIIGHEAGGERHVQGANLKALNVSRHVFNPRLSVCHGRGFEQPNREPPMTFRVEPGLALFVYLVSLREEIRVRQQRRPLPRYVERNHRNGNLSFRVDCGARVPLPNDSTTPEFRAAYSAALVDAIAAEKDDDWRELERYHELQRRRDVHRTKRAVA